MNNIKNVIIVASGKGGVGKSTITALLAMQLGQKGFRVGILDADISGPSIPTIFGVENEIPDSIDNKFQPIVKDNIKLISLGFLVQPGAALAWRGPILTKSLNQLLFSTEWGELDYLIIDMPPGTGDIHISLAQRCKINSAIIVSTPDKISIKDVERSIDLYKKLGIKISGIVQNMSYLSLDSGRISLFGEDLEDLSSRTGIKIIARLPLIPNLSDNKDAYYSEELTIDFENI